MGVGEDVRRADPIRGRHPEERPEHPGIALDRAGRTRATALLDEERVDRLLPGGGCTRRERGERLRRHRGSPGDGWTPSITQVAGKSNTMPGSSCGSLSPDLPTVDATRVRQTWRHGPPRPRQADPGGRPGERKDLGLSRVG